MAAARDDLEERLTPVGSRTVRSLRVADAHVDADGPLVVILPGLGLQFYTLPTAQSLSVRGLDCEVLDLPGFGSARPLAARPNIHAVGLAAALALAGERSGYSLVMAGPTFAPGQRRLLPLAAVTPVAYRDDHACELDPTEVGRGRLDIVWILRSGMRDAPERRIGPLRAPLTVTSGVHDAFSPVSWLDTLATSAVRAARTRTALLGGSHNNLFTHPDEVADLVCLAATDAVDWA